MSRGLIISTKLRPWVAGALGVGGALLLARWAQYELIRRSGEVVRALAPEVREPSTQDAEGHEAPPPLEPISDEAFVPVKDEARAPAAEMKKSALPRKIVGAAVVDGWIRRGAIPDVAFVPASGALPSGLVCPDAGSFVPGLRADDRLVRVNGVKVSSLEEVVAQVAIAHRADQRGIVGTFCRDERQRLRCLQLFVEMPSRDPDSAADAP